MRSATLLSTLATLPALASAIKTPRDDAANVTLSLVKLGPEEAPIWVSDEQKETFIQQHINFFDITHITDEEFLAGVSKPDGSVARRAVSYPSTVRYTASASSMLRAINDSEPQEWLRKLTDFRNRHYRSTYGTQSAAWLTEKLTEISAANPAISVSQYTHRYNQPSIVVRIPGSRDDLVVVGAHFDSTGGSSSARGPGAEDNGSGVVALMEALRVMAEADFAPENTLEFHFYSGEEGGLLGSADIWQSYKKQRKSVVGFLNQDMAGYSPSGKVSIYTDYADSALTLYARVVAQAYTGTSTTSDTCGYACSDHGSAYAAGYPAVYACDEPMATAFEDLHSPADRYDVVDFETVVRHAKFTLGFLVEASHIQI
ncbi:hypothetical protein TD95_005291 [Thielaviopsis punctulata]|uniref:Peptide hydrolase n=1 Tax=Thielaviopsis punctulata TaxID=72032 RepID=A0A0F4Z9C9_9PEZI|nr:hypothetical protein TD95_005291 [Thielaviopsis punctulata]